MLTLKRIFFGLCFIITVQSYAQFTSHKVTKGETLQTIANDYKVTKEAILKYNPEVRNGVKENAVLVIPPVVEKKEVDVTFLEHKVKRKETLYGLSKQYNISEDDIKKYNKALYSRELEKGETIQIPVFTQAVTQVATEATHANQKDLVKYVVKKAEGKWRIANNHGITIAELEELNPGIKDILDEGDVLMVPSANGASTDTLNTIVNNTVIDSTKTVVDTSNVAGDDSFSYYTVEASEGFFRIEQKTGFSQEIIEKYNPSVKVSGLTPGMILKLPKAASTSTMHPIVENVLSSSSTNLIDSIRKRKLKIALVLPFHTENYSYDSVPQMVEDVKNNKLLNISLDMYTGVLQALDSLSSYNVAIDLKVLDSKASEAQIDALYRKGEFTNVDAIIGPLYKNVFNKLALLTATDNIPVFSPLTNKGIAATKNVFSTVPTDQTLENAIVSYVKFNKQNHNIVIIADEEHAGVKSRLKSVFPSAKVTPESFITATNIKTYLSASQPNLVFVETNNIPKLTNITNVLNTVASDVYQIQLVTTDKSDAYDVDTVQNEYLNKLNFVYPSVDKPMVETENLFAKLYFEANKKYPSRIATRGFDLAMDIALRVAQGEDVTVNYTTLGQTIYNENKFNYTKSSLGFYTNMAVYIVQYKDMQIIGVE